MAILVDVKVFRSKVKKNQNILKIYDYHESSSHSKNDIITQICSNNFQIVED